MTSIYFSENQLLVAGDRAGAAENWAVMDVDRYMIGCEITDRPGFKESLANLFKKKGFSFKDTVLVLNSNQVISRLMQVPTRDEEHMLTYIGNEFSDVERAETPAFGYTMLSEDKKTKLSHVIAYLADYGMIKKYQALFSECGIELISICPALACVLHALEKEKAAGSSIVEIMEPNGLSNLLLVDGIYTYSGFHKLQNGHGTPELGVEVARSVSNIIQFAQAQHLEDEVQHVMLAGFNENDRQFASEAIEAMIPGINTVSPLSLTGRAYTECFPAAAGLHESQKTENFRLISDPTKKKKKLGAAAKLVILFSSLIVLLAVIGGIQFFRRAKRQAELDLLNEYNSSQKVIDEAEYGKALDSVIASMRERTNAYETAKDILSSFPVPDSSMINCLNRCAEGLAEVEIMKYNNSTGELTVNATAAQVDQIHSFIELIRQEKMFTVQEYSGYEYLANKQEWSISVILILNRTAEEGGAGE